jgi:hypothetical protein
MNADLQHQVTDQIIEEETALEFTPAQEAEIQRRLTQRDRIAEVEKEAIRSESRRRVSSLTGESNLEEYVAQNQRQDAIKAAFRVQIERYFGPHSNAVLATQLLKSDRPLYDKMRVAAVSIGLLSR